MNSLRFVGKEHSKGKNARHKKVGGNSGCRTSAANEVPCELCAAVDQQSHPADPSLAFLLENNIKVTEPYPGCVVPADNGESGFFQHSTQLALAILPDVVVNEYLARRRHRDVFQTLVIFASGVDRKNRPPGAGALRILVRVGTG